QVNRRILKIFLAVRTPPPVEVSRYPVLAASIFRPARYGANTASRQLNEWQAAEAEWVWHESRRPEEPEFAALPPSIRELVRTPLYMQLVKAAGNEELPSTNNTYRLLDHCVTEILRLGGHDIQRARRDLADIAAAGFPESTPNPNMHVGPQSPHDDRHELAFSCPPLVIMSADGKPEFGHDVIREYFLARRTSLFLASQ